MACGTRFKCTGASYLLVILFYCSAPLLPVLFASGAIAADTQQPATHHAHPNHHHGLSHHHRSINSTWSSRSQHTYHNRHKHEPVPHYRSYQTSTRSPPPTTTTTTTTSSSTSASVIKSGDSKQAASNVYQRLSAQESSAGRSIVYGGTVHHHRPPTQQQRELGGGGGFGGVLGPIYPNGVMTTTTSYNKYHPGRRVCSDFTSTQPQHQPQQQQQHQRNNNRSPRLVYADNQQQQPQPGFLQCCPGWTQVSPLSYGCNKPVCLVACQNGGVCSSPGRCSCPKGFTGNYCQTDVDECETEKPCDQICRNVPGSYECYCRSGYELQPDRTSCRKNDSDGTALEARDLEFDYEEATTPNTRRTSGHRDTENEVSEGEGEPEETSYVELLRRLIKLEKQFAKGKKRETEANEIAARIASAIDSINEIRRSIQNMQLMQREVYELRNKVKLYEFETRKIQHLNNRVVDLENQLRLRCRTNVFFNRGSALY